LPLQLFKSITNFLSQNVIVVFDLTEVVINFVFSDSFKFHHFSKIFFLKDGSKVNYHFSSKRMQRKKDLVRAVQNKN